MLAGTLSVPDNQPKAVIIFATGSGQQDRDETIMGHKPFKELSDRLIEQGIAVFRYDDRGCGKSTGEYGEDVLTQDLAEDLRSVFRYVKRLPQFEGVECGIFGHSEGGYEALLIANDSEVRPDFIITYGGPAVDGTEMMLNQVYAMMEGTPAEARWPVLLPILSNRYKLVTSDMPKDELKNSLWDDIKKYTPEEALIPEVTEQIQAEIDMMSSEWYRNLLRFNPDSLIKELQIPWLAIYGSTDRQIPAKPNLASFEEFGNKMITTVVLPEVNHLMQPSATGFPAEYQSNPVTLSDSLWEAIVQWINNR